MDAFIVFYLFFLGFFFGLDEIICLYGNMLNRVWPFKKYFDY